MHVLLLEGLTYPGSCTTRGVFSRLGDGGVPIGTVMSRLARARHRVIATMAA
jgi:hypothetical protein